MSEHGRFGLPGLLLAVVLVLASCGGSGGSESAKLEPDGPSSETQKESQGGMPGMDHSGMPDMDTEGMKSGSMGSEEMARQMVSPNGEYSDAAFVDAMVPHHQGAVEMAQVALENAEHEEIRSLAEDIISAQRAEIELFGEMREELGGDEPTMSTDEMNQMMGMPDAQDLALQRPFDRAFIDAMIPHHESAIEMANVALEESEDPELREIAQDIVSAQQREIAQMQAWREEWYPEG